jgi:hypothetical protein
MKNNLCRGIRKASDFLMSLQLGGAFKKNNLNNLEIQLPAVVVGGGLTAVDTATESLSYYPIQVEKILEQFETISKFHGEKNLLDSLTEEEKEHPKHLSSVTERDLDPVGLVPKRFVDSSLPIEVYVYVLVEAHLSSLHVHATDAPLSFDAANVLVWPFSIASAMSRSHFAACSGRAALISIVAFTLSGSCFGCAPPMVTVPSALAPLPMAIAPIVLPGPMFIVNLLITVLLEPRPSARGIRCWL